MGDITKRLAAYSAAAAVFMVCHEAKAQVVYTDIEPDRVLLGPFDFYNVDVDHDGSFDFHFYNFSFTFYNYTFNSYWLVQDILVGPIIDQNIIAGLYYFYSFGYGEIKRNLPYALSHGLTIDSSINFENDDNQNMALKISGFGTSNCLGCFWYNFALSETIDHYIGIRFIDSVGANHYGWIRCDVKDEGRTLVVKDYAYELQPDYPILAGSTSHFDTIDSSLIKSPLIYSFDKTLYIHVGNVATNPVVSVYDMLGRLAYTSPIVNSTSTIELSVAMGIYVVVIQDEQNTFSKKVLVE